MTIESTLFDRAKEALGVTTSKEMATKLGLAESSVSSWKSKDSIPAEHLKIIAEISLVSLDWLVLGLGKKYGNGKYDSVVSEHKLTPEEIIADEPAEAYHKWLKSINGLYLKPKEDWTEADYKADKKIQAHEEKAKASLKSFYEQYYPSQTPEFLSEYDNSKYVSIPCFDIEASAGNGSTFDLEHIIDEVMFSRVWMHAQGLFQKDLVCIQVKGDSMAGLLEDGDTVLVNTARKHGDGVFVIRIGEQVRIKRLQWLSDGHVKLISENPAYENELIDPKQLGDTFQVLGAAHTKIGRLS